MANELLHIFRTYLLTFRYIKKKESNFFVFLIKFSIFIWFFLLLLYSCLVH